MSEQIPAGSEIEDVDDPNYKPPAQKSLEEIIAADQDDESLRRYKETLLGGAAGGEAIIVGQFQRRRILICIAKMRLFSKCRAERSSTRDCQEARPRCGGNGGQRAGPNRRPYSSQRPKVQDQGGRRVQDPDRFHSSARNRDWAEIHPKNDA